MKIEHRKIVKCINENSKVVFVRLRARELWVLIAKLDANSMLQAVLPPFFVDVFIREEPQDLVKG
jgi:hypothetical protein